MVRHRHLILALCVCSPSSNNNTHSQLLNHNKCNKQTTLTPTSLKTSTTIPSNNNKKKDRILAFAGGILWGAAAAVLLIHRPTPWTIRLTANLKRSVRSVRSGAFERHFMLAAFFWAGVILQERQARRKAAEERVGRGPL